MSPEARSEQQIGSILPDFVLASIGRPEESWGLHDRAARGRGAVLIFWSSVCSHCGRYDRYLNEFAGRHPDLTMVGIASRQNESADDVRAAMSARGLTFAMLHDPGSAIANQLFTQQTPRAFLVDSASRLIYRGAIDNYKYAEDDEYEAYLEPAVEAYLAGRPVARPDTPSFGCAITSVYYTIPRPLKKI